VRKSGRRTRVTITSGWCVWVGVTGKLALAEYGLMFATGLSAVIGQRLGPSRVIVVVAAWAGIYAASMWTIDRRCGHTIRLLYYSLNLLSRAGRGRIDTKGRTIVETDQSRSALVFAYDIVAAAAAWLGAYLLRFNLELPPPYDDAAYRTLLWVVPLQAFMFWFFGLYQGIWRFASLPDLKAYPQGYRRVGSDYNGHPHHVQVKRVVPRSVLILDPMLLLLIMAAAGWLIGPGRNTVSPPCFIPKPNRYLYWAPDRRRILLLRDLSRNPRVTVSSACWMTIPARCSGRSKACPCWVL